jgi:hypothetical protein
VRGGRGGLAAGEGRAVNWGGDRGGGCGCEAVLNRGGGGGGGVEECAEECVEECVEEVWRCLVELVYDPYDAG